MRFGNKASIDSDYYNYEVALNELMSLMQSIHQVGAASNRQVTLNSAAAVEVTAGTNKRIMHIFNDTGVGVRYGGSGVTTTTGGKLFNGGSMAIAINSNTSIWMIPESGGAVTLEIVEFS